jgi:hypothetical protein
MPPGLEARTAVTRDLELSHSVEALRVKLFGHLHVKDGAA